MTTIRAFLPKTRALFSNFWKRAGETSFTSPPLVTRLHLVLALLASIFKLQTQAVQFETMNCRLHEYTFHVHSFAIYFRNFFFARKDFNFDWLFFIKLIWWNRARPIFSKIDQTNLIKQKCVKFCCMHYQIYLIQ